MIRGSAFGFDGGRGGSGRQPGRSNPPRRPRTSSLAAQSAAGGSRPTQVARPRGNRLKRGLNVALMAGVVMAERWIAHFDEEEREERQLLASAPIAEEDFPAETTRGRRVVLFVEPSPFTYVSGYNTRFRNTITQLREMGCEVLVVTTGKGVSLPGVDFYAGVEPPSEFAGAKVLGAASFGCPAYWQVPLSFALEPRIFDEVRRFGADLIHCTSPGAMCGAAWLYAKVLNKPLIFSYHTHVPAYLPKYGLGWLSGAVWGAIKLFHRSATLTIAASASLGDTLVAHGASPAHATKTWRPAVDAELFHPRWRSAAMRSRLSDGHPEDPLLVYVGRVGAEKNIGFLGAVLAANPAARLAIVGDGPARAELEAELGPTGRVHFLGTLRGADLSAAYASGDVFVMPSETETLGFVVLEAMSSGLPVVAVRAGGIPDIVTAPGTSGFLYEPGDAAAASQAVKALLGSEQLRARVGAAAREHTAQWGWEAATRHMLSAQYPLAMALHARQQAADSQPSSAGAWGAAAVAAKGVISMRAQGANRVRGAGGLAGKGAVAAGKGAVAVAGSVAQRVAVAATKR